MVDILAAAADCFFSEAAPVPGRHWPRYLHDTPGLMKVQHRPVATFGAPVVGQFDLADSNRPTSS